MNQWKKLLREKNAASLPDVDVQIPCAQYQIHENSIEENNWQFNKPQDPS